MVTLERHEPRGIIQFPSSYGGHAAAFADAADVHAQSPEARPQAPERPAVRGGPAVEVEVRRARLGDVLSLPRFTHQYELNFPETPSQELQPVRTVLKGALPFTGSEHPVFVARIADDHRVLGIAHFHAVGPDQRWMATCIRTNSGVYEDDPIVLGLMHHAIKEAGLHGVKRLYAKSDVDSPVRGPLRAIGFAPYMTETILAAPHVPVLSSGGAVRTLEQADVWAIHQLYIHTTPRDVQYAEAFTSHNWDVGTIHRERGLDCRAWCITRDFTAAAYVRAVTHRDAHVVDFMVAQEWRDLLPDLLSEVFRSLSTMSSRRVYVSVRGYQREVIPLLEHYGFAEQVQQELSVRYTTASVRSSVISVESYAPERAAEPGTKRVPSFFQRGSLPVRNHNPNPARLTVSSDRTHVPRHGE